MPGDLNDYLASRYLVADPKPTKKRKRKQAEDTPDEIEGLEEEFGWLQDIPPQDESWLHFAMFTLLEKQG